MASMLIFFLLRIHYGYPITLALVLLAPALQLCFRDCGGSHRFDPHLHEDVRNEEGLPGCAVQYQEQLQYDAASSTVVIYYTDTARWYALLYTRGDTC